MKKYFFFAVAALGLAACAEKGLDNGAQKGEIEESYVAVTLTADDMFTKAEGDYEEGTAAERAVKSAYFFFFHQEGKAFTMQPGADAPTENARTTNYLSLDLEGNTENMPNVSDVKDAVLVFENYKGEYPDQIVAVLNWIPTKATYTLSELKTVISELGNDTDGYVMSNSTYANSNSKTVDAVELKLSNIGKDIVVGRD